MALNCNLHSSADLYGIETIKKMNGKEVCVLSKTISDPHDTLEIELPRKSSVNDTSDFIV